VTSSGKDEPVWVVIHICMLATLYMCSLYRYVYLILGKNAMCFLLTLMPSLQQNWGTRGRNKFCQEAVEGVCVGGGGPNNVYTCD
jgi:hypothetical protein